MTNKIYSSLTEHLPKLKLTSDFENNIGNILDIFGDSLNAECASLNNIVDSKLDLISSWSKDHNLSTCNTLNECVNVTSILNKKYNSSEIFIESLHIGFCNAGYTTYAVILIYGNPVAVFVACFNKDYNKEESFKRDFTFIVSLLQMEIERNRGEELLRERERDYSILFENAPDAIAIVNNCGFIMEHNNVLEELLCVETDSIIGEELSDFLYKKDSELFMQEFLLLKTKKEIEFETSIIINNISTPLWIKAKGIFEDNNEFKGGVIYLRDISELKKAEESKLIHERFLGVLEMSGAACHELNQPLQAISGLSVLLKKKIIDADKTKWVEKISEQVVKMGEITKKISHISEYKTKDYVSGSHIIDIEEASKNIKDISLNIEKTL